MTPTTQAVAAYESDAQVIEATSRAAAVLTRAQAITVKDQATEAEATDLLAEARKGTKGIEALRRSFVDPLNEHVKNINAFFRRGATPLADADRLLGQKLTDYRAKVAEAARKEEERLRAQQEAKHAKAVERAEAKGLEAPPAMPLVPTIARPAKTVEASDGGAKVTYVERWGFEITDAAAVPREFCCPDEKKIGQLVRAKFWQPDQAPPGIKITVTHEPTVR